MTSKKPELIGNYQVSEGRLRTRREVLLLGALAAGSAVAASAVGTAALAEQHGDAAAAPQAVPGGASPSVLKQYTVRDYSHLIRKNMPGLSAEQIEQHLKLYAGYVGKINEIQNALMTVNIETPAPNATYHPYRELLVEQSFALNGVIYHELYFENLGGPGGEPSGPLRASIDERWGGFGKFVDYFKAAGKCMRGWVIMGWNTRDNVIHTYGLDAHNMWVPANTIPIIVLDVYEHAYMIDYGINRGSYLDAFMNNMDWEVCARRFDTASRHAHTLPAS